MGKHAQLVLIEENVAALDSHGGDRGHRDYLAVFNGGLHAVPRRPEPHARTAAEQLRSQVRKNGW